MRSKLLHVNLVSFIEEVTHHHQKKRIQKRGNQTHKKKRRKVSSKTKCNFVKFLFLGSTFPAVRIAATQHPISVIWAKFFKRRYLTAAFVIWKFILFFEGTKKENIRQKVDIISDATFSRKRAQKAQFLQHREYFHQAVARKCFKWLLTKLEKWLFLYGKASGLFPGQKMLWNKAVVLFVHYYHFFLQPRTDCGQIVPFLTFCKISFFNI